MSDDASGRYVLIEDLERVPDSLIDTLPVGARGRARDHHRVFLANYR